MPTIRTWLRIASLLLGLTPGLSRAQTLWLAVQAQHYRTLEPLPAHWQWTDATGKLIMEGSAAAGGWTGFVPKTVRFLVISSAGYRVIRLPIQRLYTQPDSASARVTVPLVPIDKPLVNQPYFQSEQRPLQIQQPTRRARVPVRILICDALTNRAVRAECCLISTQNHQRICSTVGIWQTEFARPDIIAIEVRALHYQTYWGNIVVADTSHQTTLNVTIRLNPMPTLLAVTMSTSANKDSFNLLIRSLPTGIRSPLIALDSTHFLGMVAPGTYQLIREVRHKPAIVIDTVSLYEGINVYVPRPVAAPAWINAVPDGILYFAQSSYDLSDSARHQLDRIVIQLQQQPQHRLLIVGHTDNVGDPRLNRALSEFRAKNTRAYLYRRGITDERMQLDFFGADRPATISHSEEKRRLNRRVNLYFR